MSFTPNSAGTQEGGGRGNGGGGRSRSAGKRRGKKKNANPQHTDTSPPLPDLQAQTLFAPGTTGGAADEETRDQTKLEEAKRIQEAAVATEVLGDACFSSRRRFFWGGIPTTF